MISQKLKRETTESHQKLEKKIILQIKNIKRDEEYGRLIAAFYGFISPLEQQIMGKLTESTMPDIGQRAKANLLEDDLNEIGAEIMTKQRVDLPEIRNQYDAIGALYVLEGSTLGGQIIKKMVQKALNKSTDTGFAYFSSYGSETRTYWANFIRTIDSMELQNDEEEAIIARANDTFQKFYQYMAYIYNEN